MVKHAENKADCFYDQDAIRGLLGVTAKAIGVACRDRSFAIANAQASGSFVVNG